MTNEDREAYQAELDGVPRCSDERLQIEAVVDWARVNKQSRMHAWVFDKGVKGAAEEHYKQRARHLLRVVYVLVDAGTGVVRDKMVSLEAERNTEDNGYRPVCKVLTDAELRQLMLVQAVNELRRFLDNWESQYGELDELPVGKIKGYCRRQLSPLVPE